MIASSALFAFATVGPVLIPQDAHVYNEQLQSVFTQTDSASGSVGRLSSLFKQDARRTVRQTAITADTQSFSASTFRRIVRENTANISWNGYTTIDGRNEVMTTTWRSGLGQCVWVDNGYTVTVACTLKQQSGLSDVEATATFVEESLQVLLQVPVVRPEKIRHRLRPVEMPQTLWAGIYSRDMPVVEEIQADGSVRLKGLRLPKWHEHLTVATDGRVFIVSFNLSEPQKHPLGVSRTPGKYVPYRFTKT